MPPRSVSAISTVAFSGMWSSLSVSVRRPIVTTGGCSRKIDASRGSRPARPPRRATAAELERLAVRHEAEVQKVRATRHVLQATPEPASSRGGFEIPPRGPGSPAARHPGHAVDRTHRSSVYRCSDSIPRRRGQRAAPSPASEEYRFETDLRAGRGRSSRALLEHPAVTFEVLGRVQPARRVTSSEDGSRSRPRAISSPRGEHRGRRPRRRSRRRPMGCRASGRACVARSRGGASGSVVGARRGQHHDVDRPARARRARSSRRPIDVAHGPAPVKPKAPSASRSPRQ